MRDAAEQSGAAQAFSDLQAEIALMRRGIEALAVERASNPDYALTLQYLADRQNAVAGVLKQLLATPAIKMTPAEFGLEMSRSTEHLRVADRQAIAEAGAELHRAVGRLGHLECKIRSSEDQRRALVLAGGAGAFAGMLVWAVLPGMLARALPERWNLPEWMAARTIGAGEEEAGLRLLVAARQRMPTEAVQGVSSRAAARTSDAPRSQVPQQACREGLGRALPKDRVPRRKLRPDPIGRLVEDGTDNRAQVGVLHLIAEARSILFRKCKGVCSSVPAFQIGASRSRIIILVTRSTGVAPMCGNSCISNEVSQISRCC